MTNQQRQILDDTLADLQGLPLTDRQKSEILRREAKKFNAPVPPGDLDNYLRDRGLPV